ncbi:uracil phosphoribosyltransferase [Waterburya agarophytonicola K14]|uniref:Uracil phosphoribosyltransferase n=1 Tax=Waterburya agarophytonicola KI4 TaxID=2874699 RepID=A0A964BQB1_9CYAN|nr:uracil phosphoribosyltransferase [Waterburya agarophytonicola]MCC0177435.1 uracil phosphoribosyltransferase [Waterburya agarophytonicola KI4]
MTLQLRVYVPEHPLIKHWLSVARDVNTPPVLFKSAMSELGRWLTYEAVRNWLPTVDTMVQTPLTECAATFVNPQTPIGIVPILRAGLALLDEAQKVIPTAAIYHLGLVRDESSLEPACYLNKLPDRFAPQTRIVILEPMLATGGSIMMAMKEIISRGVSPELIRIISIVAAPPALRQLSKNYPGLEIYTAIIDEGLNSKGYIVPGLGDAGDRSFGT